VLDHNLITRNRLLAGLPPSELALLAPKLSAVSMKEGDILQEPDMRCSKFALVSMAICV